MPSTRLRIVLVTCMLLFIIMEGAKPVMGKKKGTKARVKALEKKVEEMENLLKCKPCSKIIQLTERLNKIDDEIEKLKNPPTSSPPPPLTSPAPPAVCAPVGVADPNKIPDAQMTASSNYLQYYAKKGRLNGETGWCQGPSTISNDYIQVDMGAVRTVCAVATQGKKNGAYVTSYKLSLSTDGVSWNTYQEENTDKIFQANEDLDSIVQHTLKNPAQARYVRFYPVTCYRYPCMRVEVFVQ